MREEMINANDLTDAFARNVSIIQRQTEGLTHADSLRQPPFRGNCLNWVLGHIAESRNTILELLGQPIEVGALARYKRGSDPLTESGEATLRLEEIIAWLDRSQERIAAALSQADEAILSRQVMVGNRTMTVAQRIFFLYFHESYHVGQTELFRQLAGKDDKII
jgi:uncharacterized damage-inducible protein DinB